MTLDGDRADKKGALVNFNLLYSLEGSMIIENRDLNPSRESEIGKTRFFANKWVAFDHYLLAMEQSKKRLVVIDQKVTQIRDRMTALDMHQKKWADEREPISSDVYSLNKEKTNVEEMKAQKLHYLEGLKV